MFPGPFVTVPLGVLWRHWSQWFKSLIKNAVFKNPLLLFLIMEFPRLCNLLSISHLNAWAPSFHTCTCTNCYKFWTTWHQRYTLAGCGSKRVGALSLKAVDWLASSCPSPRASLAAVTMAVTLSCETVFLLPLSLFHVTAQWESLCLYCRDSQSRLPPFRGMPSPTPRVSAPDPSLSLMLSPSFPSASYAQKKSDFVPEAWSKNGTRS